MRVKAYLMLELLVVVLIMAFISLLFIRKMDDPDFSDYIFMSEYLKVKSTAMAKHEELIYNEELVNNDYPIIFDKNGTVNQAQTIITQKSRIVINLGTGYLSYEN